MCANYSEVEKNDDVEMVLVPRHPTKEMIEAAWADALAEDAKGVWRCMIDEWILGQQRKPIEGQ